MSRVPVTHHVGRFSHLVDPDCGLAMPACSSKLFESERVTDDAAKVTCKSCLTYLVKDAEEALVPYCVHAYRGMLHHKGGKVWECVRCGDSVNPEDQP
jgi:hypothetical protein